MDISSNNALTAVSYGAVGCVSAMAAANVVLVGAGVGSKARAYVADYFKNESIAQNLRIKGDQLISLAGKYAATKIFAVKAEETAKEAERDAKLLQEKKQRELDAKKGIFVGRPNIPDVTVINKDINDSNESVNVQQSSHKSHSGYYDVTIFPYSTILYFTLVAVSSYLRAAR